MVNIAQLKAYLQKEQPFTATEVRAGFAEQGIKADVFDCLNILEDFGDEVRWSCRGGYTFESAEEDLARFASEPLD